MKWDGDDLGAPATGCQSAIHFPRKQCHVTQSWSTFMALVFMNLSWLKNQSKLWTMELENIKFIMTPKEPGGKKHPTEFTLNV